MYLFFIFFPHRIISYLYVCHPAGRGHVHPSRTTNINIVLIAYMQWDVCSAATMVGGQSDFAPPHHSAITCRFTVYTNQGRTRAFV